MKNNIVYIAIFVGAFLLVSGGIFYLNSKFTNIFAFDFTPPGTVQSTSKPNDKTDKTKEEINADAKFRNTILDSIPEALSATMLDQSKGTLSPRDTVVKTVVDTTLKDSIKQLQQKIKELTDKKELKKDSRGADTVKQKPVDLTNVIQKSDSTYKSWLKKTISLYEAMDSRKAAKIILTYSDNIAKDIIYSMKKKKAADILAQLNPETVNRITRVKQ